MVRDVLARLTGFTADVTVKSGTFHDVELQGADWNILKIKLSGRDGPKLDISLDDILQVAVR